MRPFWFVVPAGVLGAVGGGEGVSLQVWCEASFPEPFFISDCTMQSELQLSAVTVIVIVIE